MAKKKTVAQSAPKKKNRHGKPKVIRLKPDDWSLCEKAADVELASNLTAWIRQTMLRRAKLMTGESGGVLREVEFTDAADAKLCDEVAQLEAYPSFSDWARRVLILEARRVKSQAG